MVYFSRKEQIIIIISIIIIVLISAFGFINKNFKTSKINKEDSEMVLEDLSLELEEEIDKNQAIMVHISGEVYKPGLVELNLDSRVIDAVNLAGGLKKDSDLDRINLAKKLSDEEKIYIPKKGEENPPIEVSSNINFGDNYNANGLIDINRCTKEELMSLPGVGEVLAKRILDYREGIPFKSIDDIKNVSGIGEKRFESIKELIIVK